MKKQFIKIGLALLTLCLPLSVNAQNSLPAPGSGSSSAPPPGTGGLVPPPPPGGGYWGSPWNGPMVTGVPMSSPYWQNSGQENVLSCGYDVQGIWRVVPLTVTYTYNGIQYNVEVINAYNPWTNMWDYGVDANAYNTYYYLRGSYFNYYVVLSTGTYYFNLS